MTVWRDALIGALRELAWARRTIHALEVENVRLQQHLMFVQYNKARHPHPHRSKAA